MVFAVAMNDRLGTDHFVARAQAERHEREVQRRRARRDRDGVLRPDVGRERRLELRHARPLRQPPGAQHRRDRSLLLDADERLGDWDGLAHQFLRRASSALTSTPRSRTHAT
jgi:hypothetical protein